MLITRVNKNVYNLNDIIFKNGKNENSLKLITRSNTESLILQFDNNKILENCIKLFNNRMANIKKSNKLIYLNNENESEEEVDVEEEIQVNDLLMSNEIGVDNSKGVEVINEENVKDKENIKNVKNNIDQENKNKERNEQNINEQNKIDEKKKEIVTDKRQKENNKEIKKGKMGKNIKNEENKDMNKKNEIPDKVKEVMKSYSISICNKKQQVKEIGELILNTTKLEILFKLKLKVQLLPITKNTKQMIHPKNRKFLKLQNDKSANSWYILFDSSESCKNFYNSLSNLIKNTFLKFNVIIFDTIKKKKSKAEILFEKKGLNIVQQIKESRRVKGGEGVDERGGKGKEKPLEKEIQKTNIFFKFNKTNLKLKNDKPLICKIYSTEKNFIIKFNSIEKLEKFSNAFCKQKKNINNVKEQVIIQVKIIKASNSEINCPKNAHLFLQEKLIKLQIKDGKKYTFNYMKEKVRITHLEKKDTISKVYLDKKNKFIFAFKNSSKRDLLKNFFKK
ncbi:hypothetical protein M0812_04581 [Anaeramoeba flamelloides]|uniref:Uncharacterized protein n=1 Tax=Anaeramoeba flamelloides TaxID=1746091 RepID=A0AAV8AF24_9EUKA|nr:hypothetical protein M0812_04581 [Anaeramoeba flamelloides]